MIRSFKELTAERWTFAGGKGGTLARLYQAGYAVPDGFIILPAAFTGDELAPEAWRQQVFVWNSDSVIGWSTRSTFGAMQR